MEPRYALWKIDHTVCMNGDKIDFNIDKPEDYPDGNYDENDTDCKNWEDYGECYDSLDCALDDLEQYQILEKQLGMPLDAFLKVLRMLDQDKFTYAYFTAKKEMICTALTPVRFSIDMKKCCFIELQRPEKYEQKLYFKDFGKLWDFTAEELKRKDDARKVLNISEEE